MIKNNKKGLVISGPTFIFINLFILLISVFKVIIAFGLVSGIVFNKQIRERKISFLLAKIIGIIILMMIVIILVNLVGGPTSNHYIAMIYGTFIFAILLTLFSINSLKNDFKNSSISILIISLLFLIFSEVGVYILISNL